MSKDIVKIYWNEHMRLRPGMYIGSSNSYGYNKMLEFLLEFLFCNCAKNPIIEIFLYPENKLILKLKKVNVDNIVCCLQNLPSINDELKGMGLSLVVALSSKVEVRVSSKLSQLVLTGVGGKYEIKNSPIGVKENVVCVDFVADKNIFSDLKTDFDSLNRFLKNFAFLNPNWQIVSYDRITSYKQKIVFHYPEGVLNLFENELNYNRLNAPRFLLKIKDKVEDYDIKIGLAFACDIKQTSMTYAGNDRTYLNGSLYDGVINGFKKVIKETSSKFEIELSSSRKQITDDLFIVASLKGNGYNFYGATRGKLYMPIIEKKVSRLVYERLTSYLENDLDAWKSFVHNFEVER
jgi:DNA gyrase/topoisomerase IV subunit B